MRETDLLTTKKVGIKETCEFGPVSIFIHDCTLQTSFMQGPYIKTITVCSLYKTFFVVGIAVTLLFSSNYSQVVNNIFL